MLTEVKPGSWTDKPISSSVLSTPVAVVGSGGLLYVSQHGGNPLVVVDLATSAVTPLPVIGVPVPLKYLDGMDSLLSIVQMPAGVPVATVAVGGARNAGLLAVRILAATSPELQQKMTDFQAALKATAQEKGAVVRGDSAGRRVGF